jgi:hypothetical protein
MAITTLDGALAGMQPPREFCKAVTGTLVTGRWHSTTVLAGQPPAMVFPVNKAITSSSVANPTLITCSGHGMATSGTFLVSISGHTGSTPALDGVYTATYNDANSFTIPVNVSGGGGATGVACCIDPLSGSQIAGLTGKIATNAMAGSIPFTNPGSGNSYLARFQGQTLIAGTLLLCDLLWFNGGISATKTTIQSFTNSVQIPARDRDGTNTGYEVYPAALVTSAMGASAPTITVGFNDTLGNAQTGTNIFANANSAIAGTMFPISLPAGCLGVQKATSLTFSGTATSGTMNVILYRVLARLEINTNNLNNAIDAITSGFPKIHNDSCLFVAFIPATTTTGNITGQVVWTQG